MSELPKNHSVRRPSSRLGSTHSIGMNSSRFSSPTAVYISEMRDIGLRQWPLASRVAMATIGAACAVDRMNANSAA